MVDDGVFPFFDEASRTYRCSMCSASVRLIQLTERKVKKFLARAAPHKNVPKIESLKRLRELQKDCYKLSYEDPSGHVVTFHPAAFPKGTRKTVNDNNGQKAKPRMHTVSYIKSALAGFSRRGVVPRIVRGLCLRCDKLVLSHHDGALVHQKCLYEWQRERGPRARLSELVKQPKPGVKKSLETLQKRWVWTIRHKLGGDSLGDIAQEFGVSKEAVSKGITVIMSQLPGSEQVPRLIRQRVELLRSTDQSVNAARLENLIG
jgi:hypothetical protein